MAYSYGFHLGNLWGLSLAVTQEAALRRTFGVAFRVGRGPVGVSWPFGRLDVDDDELVLRSIPPAPWSSRPCTVRKDALREITLHGTRPVSYLVLDYAEQDRKRARVRPQFFNSNTIISELQARGYPVLDCRVSPLPMLRGNG